MDYWFFYAIMFISPVQFNVEIMEDSAAAESRPSHFRGSSPETESAHFTEQGKYIKQGTHDPHAEC